MPAEDRSFATRLARYCARHPVALSRLTYAADRGTVTYRSDKTSGPTAGAGDVLPSAPTDVRRRWAALLRRLFDVDPLRCPRCGSAMASSRSSPRRPRSTGSSPTGGARSRA